jgi:hypothetical protein
MYLGRVRVIDCSPAAALAHVSAVVTPPATAAHNLGEDLRKPFWGRRLAAFFWRRRESPLRDPPRRVQRPDFRWITFLFMDRLLFVFYTISILAI